MFTERPSIMPEEAELKLPPTEASPAPPKPELVTKLPPPEESELEIEEGDPDDMYLAYMKFVREKDAANWEKIRPPEAATNKEERDRLYQQHYGIALRKAQLLVIMQRENPEGHEALPQFQATLNEFWDNVRACAKTYDTIDERLIADEILKWAQFEEND